MILFKTAFFNVFNIYLIVRGRGKRYKGKKYNICITSQTPFKVYSAYSSRVYKRENIIINTIDSKRGKYKGLKFLETESLQDLQTDRLTDSKSYGGAE